MHQDGIRYFLEVGPYGSLSTFVSDILPGKEYLSIATNIRRRNGMEQLLTALGHLFVNQRFAYPERLFATRRVQVLDMENYSHVPVAAMLLDNSMPVLRLDEADRAALLKIMAPVCSTVLTMNSGAGDVQRLPERPKSASGHEAAAMADYFGVMRSFLEQQCKAMEHWAGNLAKLQDIFTISCPFLDSIKERDDRHLVAECSLSLHENSFLKDHVLSGAVSDDPGLLGLSCLPLAVSLEMMAEACAVLAGSIAVCIIEDVMAFGWIALEDRALALEIHAELVDPENSRYRATIINDGVVMVSADFLFKSDWRIELLAELKNSQEYFLDEHQMYTTGLFHGSVFQSIRCVDGWSAEGIDAQLSEIGLSGFFDTKATPQMVLNPVLLDAFGQLSAFWIKQQVGRYFSCFPSTIGRIELYEQAPQNLSGLILRARQHPLDPASTNMGGCAWRFECRNSQGLVLLRVTNLINIFFSVPFKYFEVRNAPLTGCLGNELEINGRKEVTLWQLTQLEDIFCTQSGGIFLRLLAHAILSAVERTAWQGLSASTSLRLEWLFGRACIKEAVRFRVMQETGKSLYPTDIVVLNDEHGAHYVDGWWNGSLIPAPEVSLGSGGRMAVAAVTYHQHPVGVGVVQVGIILQPELPVYTQNERLLVGGLDNDAMQDRLLRIWCAKEAAAKFFKLGLLENPALFEVSTAGDNWESVFVTYAGMTVEVAFMLGSDSIVALASQCSGAL